LATIKAVSSKASIGTSIDYVTREEKTDDKLLSGIGCGTETAKEEMQATKELWGKTDGRTYKHFTQNFAPGEPITLEQAHGIAKKLAENVDAWKGHEVLIATHKDKKHIHTHFIVNSVNYEDGYKLQWSKDDLKKMKEYSDELCRENGLSVTIKGKTFEGIDREETSAYTKESYHMLKKAEKGEVKSYVQDTALAVLDCKEEATSRTDFIARMDNRGYKVDWQDNHKYITFTDKERESQGESKCKIRNNKLEKYYNVDFGKEGLESGFEINARREQATERAREQLQSGTNRTAEPEDRTAPSRNIGTFLNELNVDERTSEEKRDNKISQREDREVGRERLRAEAERGTEKVQQEVGTRQAGRRRYRSTDGPEL